MIFTDHDHLEADRVDGGSACHPPAVLDKLREVQVEVNLAEDHPKGAALEARYHSDFEVTYSSEVVAAAEPGASSTPSAPL